MKTNHISRRKFIRLTGAGVVAGMGTAMLFSQPGHSATLKNKRTYGKISAGEVIERIKKNIGVPWKQVTVDTVKGGGSPGIIVTGITTTFMATLDVLEKSVKAGNNFILAHEPTFWTNLDLGEGLTGDLLYLYKQEYIKNNNLFVHRFHDNWHARRPDGIFEGWSKVMGWDKYHFDEANNFV